MPFHPIAENDVHLWFLPNAAMEVERFCTEGFDLLTPDERDRYRSYRHSKRATQFLLGRILMRRGLAAHMPLASNELRFSYGPNGKPELHSKFSGNLVFSISHARAGAVMAIACAERIGVDVEQSSRASSILRIARQFFSAAEKRQLECDGVDAQDMAIAFWGLKESIVKASGCTIWEGLSGVRLAQHGKRIQWLSAPPNGLESEWILMRGRDQAGRSLALALKRKYPISQPQEVHTHILGNEAARDAYFRILSASGLVVA